MMTETNTQRCFGRNQDGGQCPLLMFHLFCVYLFYGGYILRLLIETINVM